MMILQTLKRFFFRTSRHSSLRTVLVIPFILQIVLAIGLVGYFSFYRAQQSINEVTSKLRQEITRRIEQHVRAYLQVPYLINQTNSIALRLGLLSLNDPETIARHFWEQVNAFNTISYIYIGNEKGGLVTAGRRQDGTLTSAITDNFEAGTYRTYETDSKGELKKLLTARPQYDARSRPWYQLAIKQGGPLWGNVYNHFSDQSLAIPAVSPIYDAQGKILGVLTTDLLLSHINDFLKSLSIGYSGEMFIIERSGLLISSSANEKLFFNIGFDQTIQRRAAIDSNVPLIRYTAEHLKKQFNDLTQIKNEQQLEFGFNNQRQFIQVTPLQDQWQLDWLIVVVIPETDFMKKMNVNIEMIIWFSCVGLLISLLLGILTARWIIKPIQDLNLAVHQLSKGQWHQNLPLHRTDELGSLARSFNRMAEQLQRSFSALQDKNSELQARENRLKQFLEAVPVGIAMVDSSGCPFFANHRAQELLGKGRTSKNGSTDISETYQLHMVGTQQLYPFENLPIIRALRGESTWIEDIEIHSSERVIPLEVWGTPIFDESGKIIFGMAAFQDITERRQLEVEQQQLAIQRQRLNEELASYSQTLEQQVATHTITLYEREQTLNAVLAATSDTILVLKLDGTIVVANPTAAKRLNSTQYELIGRNVYDLLPISLAEQRRAFISQVIYSEESSTLIDEQSGRWFESTYCPMSGNNGVITRIAVFSRDITERKLAEQAIKNSENRLRTIFNAVYDAVIIHDLDGRVLDVNDKMLEMYQVSRKQALQLTIDDYSAPNNPFDEIPLIWKRVLTGKTQIVEWKARRPNDNQFFDVEIVLRKVTLDGQDRLLATIRDITRRKRVENELRTSDARLQAIIRSLPFDFWMLGTDERYVLQNDISHQLWGDIIGKRLEDLETDKTSIASWRKYYQRVLAGETVRDEVQCSLNGKNYHFYSIVSPLFNDNHFMGILGINMDITERKQMEETLVKSLALQRAVIESTADAIMVLDINRNVISCNQKLAEMWGLPPNWVEKLDAQNRLDLFLAQVKEPEEFRKRVSELMVDLELETTDVLEMIDGRIIERQARTFRVGNKIAGRLYAYRDITARKLAEEALRESEERFAIFMDNMPAFVFIKDHEHCNLYINKPTYERFGGNWMGRTAHELFPTGIAEKMIADDRLALEEGLIVGTEVLIDKHGNEGFYQVHKFRIPRQDNPPLLGGIAIDITESRKIQDALCESLARTEAILQAIPYMVFVLDDTGYCIKVLATNEGNSYGESKYLEGHHLHEIICAEVASKIVDTIRIVLTTNSVQVLEFPLVLQQKYQWFEARLAPLHGNPYNRPVVIYVSSNITDRKHAQEALQLAQFALEHAADGIYWIDKKGHHIYVNNAACEMLDYNRHQLLALHVPDISPTYPVSNWELFWDSIKESGSTSFETYYQRRDGHLFPVEITANLLIFNGNEYVCALVRDITERKREQERLEQAKIAAEDALRKLQAAQQQLIESEKLVALGNLVAGIAHEINTPIGVGVSAASQMEELVKELVQTYANGEMKRSHLEKFLKLAQQGSLLILRNLSRAAELVQSFKQVAVDQTSEQKRMFNLKVYLQEILTSLQPAFKRTQFQVITVCPEDVSLLSYPGAFSQIITNLVMNSLAHGFSGQSEGTITITVQTDVEQITLHYQDNGKGISKEHLSSIFEPFFTTNRQGGGSGLGLHIVYNLITRKLNGAIHCESKVGEGTHFFMKIPLQREHYHD